MIELFKQLLPKSRAFRLYEGSTLKRFFVGLDTSDIKLNFDNVFNDFIPEFTRNIDKYEEQFNLIDSGQLEVDRRLRVAASWLAIENQSPKFIQDTLHANGFTNLFIHEWNESSPAVGVKSCLTYKNPHLYLRRQYVGEVVANECGETYAQCGEQFAECGNEIIRQGYPLVNKAITTKPNYFSAGDNESNCGEIECGDYDSFIDYRRDYIVPIDPEKYPYFLYFGGVNFGDIAQIDANRREELESLCLKISPAQQWLGMLVQYI